MIGMQGMAAVAPYSLAQPRALWSSHQVRRSCSRYGAQGAIPRGRRVDPWSLFTFSLTCVDGVLMG